MAGMPYPPTSVRIRAICGRLFSARGSVYSVHSVGASSPLVLLVQFLLWQAAKPSGDSCTPWVGSVGMAGMPYPPTSVRSVRSVGVLSLQEVLCIRCIPWELLHRLSVGAAETAAPPGGIHGSSAHISPPHHLTTTTPFHLEPSLLHVLPVLWVRLRYHLRLVDAQPGEHDGSRCERHRHAVVVVRVYRL